MNAILFLNVILLSFTHSVTLALKWMEGKKWAKPEQDQV
jgi:hypothetical protein